jgi:hypothetical protein
MKAGRAAVVDGAAALAGMTVRADGAAAGESPYRMFRTGTQQFMRTFLTFTGGSEEPRGRSALSVTPAVCFRGDPRLTDYGRFRSFPDERDGPDGSGLSDGRIPRRNQTSGMNHLPPGRACAGPGRAGVLAGWRARPTGPGRQPLLVRGRPVDVRLPAAPQRDHLGLADARKPADVRPVIALPGRKDHGHALAVPGVSWSIVLAARHRRRGRPGGRDEGRCATTPRARRDLSRYRLGRRDLHVPHGLVFEEAVRALREA